MLSRERGLVGSAEPEKSRAGAWTLVRELMRPRRRLLALGVVLMVVNRVAGLALPSSAKVLVDNIINKKQVELLVPVVLAVLAATIIQGLTSFALTQLLSKEGLRLVAELRRRVQQHIGRLPVTYHDSTKGSMLAKRIMWDVDGVRNLIGTGLMDFVGGVLTALFSLVILLRISVVLTGTAPRILILDEATSSLDSESEAAVQQGMEYLLEGRTTFVIAHRLSTIRRAHQILVLDEGRVVERGTHASLYAAGGRYYDLYTRQHGMDADMFLAPDEEEQVSEAGPEVSLASPFGVRTLTLIDSQENSPSS